MATPESSRILVVLAPDLVGQAFADAACGEVFKRWRDGFVWPVVNRALLVRYLKVLRELGLPESLVRRWGWWFTAHEKVVFLPDTTSAGLTGAELCRELARISGAQAVVGGATSSVSEAPGVERGPTVKWIKAEEFLLEPTPPSATHHP